MENHTRAFSKFLLYKQITSAYNKNVVLALFCKLPWFLNGVSKCAMEWDVGEIYFCDDVSFTNNLLWIALNYRH